VNGDSHKPNAYQEQCRRRIAVRKLIEDTGNADLLEWVEKADLESMNHDAALTFMGEWATQIREALPEDFDFGCGCPSCTITRGLNHFCSEVHA
jgi:hypothetical protein